MRPRALAPLGLIAAVAVVLPAAAGAETCGPSARSIDKVGCWLRTVVHADDVTSPAPLELGINSGSALQADVPFVQRLGARTVRVEFDIATPVAAMAPDIEAYARAGIRPLLLAGFPGRQPSAGDAANLASWAATYGPGGSFWADKPYPSSVAPIHIEFGNETSYAYQYAETKDDPNWAQTPFYAAMAKNYAVQFKTASQAVAGVNTQVDLLAVGDVPGNWPAWMDSLFAAVPDFGRYVGGWTVHPYGPDGERDISNTVARAKAEGAADSIPIYATELGIATDDGRCLSGNYGWDACMGYDEAARTLTRAVAGIRSTYRDRLRGIWLYAAHDQQPPGAVGEREAYFGALTAAGADKGPLTGAVRSLLEG